jgi:Tol biopolymer transport system component
MLTFIRGESPFFGPGQIYVKLLPDGEPVQLTRDNFLKMSPKFSPDGTRIAYSTGSGDASNSLDTWLVPALGGQPQKLLTNAEGLTWINNASEPSRILFSELTGRGGQMSLVTATESRADARTVYLPRSESGMAHRSYLSPDGKWLLAIEMEKGSWLPCRLVPFDGSSVGKPVGPAPAQCTDAAWSPDGKWMYFSTNTGGGTHTWRQQFPDGTPEQITSGVTQEDGIHFAPDGKSFVTSIGTSQSTVWAHDASGTRQITSEGYSFRPAISPDRRKVYYLVRGESTGSFIAGGLWAVDLASGQKQRLLPDFQMQYFSISSDGQRIVFVGDSAGNGVWIAPLNAQTPPRRLSSSAAFSAFFGAPGEVIFDSDENGTLFMYRIGEDGSGLRKLPTASNIFAVAVSPDGQWIAAQDSRQWGALKLFPRDQGEPVVVCESCSPPHGTDPMPADGGWTPDGKFMYLRIDGSTHTVPLRDGKMLPQIPAGGFASKDVLAKVSGVRTVSGEAIVFAGPDPETYAFTKITTQRNLYRVPVP